MYESFYHLRAKPFSLIPDTRFFFPSGGHNRVLAFLRYGIYNQEGFIVVAGDVGTGKTTLVNALLEELAQKKDLMTAHLAMTQWDANELLPMVAGGFGLSDVGLSKTALLQRLVDFLKDQTQQGRRAVLIVDEAQNLSIQALETLRLLANYQVGHRALVQGFLIGQASFAKTLAESESLEALRQRIIASCFLRPMSPEETRRYIEHRLSIVGWKSDPIFLPAAYEAIYEYTGGVPRRINSLCDRTLLVAYLEETHEISEQLVKTVIQELDEESLAATPAAGKDAKAKTHALARGQVPSSSAAATPESLSSTQERLLRVEIRLDSIESALASSGLVKGLEPTSSTRELEQLRIQLAETLADNKLLQEKLAAQQAEAEQVREALEKEIANLLYRLMPDQDNGSPWQPDTGRN